MMIELYPSLEVIREDLFPSREITFNFSDEEMEIVFNEAKENPKIPKKIKEMIKRRIEVRNKNWGESPSPGQIVYINRDKLKQVLVGEEKLKQIKVPRRPIGFLLNELVEGNVWYGWIAANEVEYACLWDLILEEEDYPFDPLIGMIQLWNPCYIEADRFGGILGALNTERLTAARALAYDYLINDYPPDEKLSIKPGELVKRQTVRGLPVKTGQLIQKEVDDIRFEYQRLYYFISQEIMGLKLFEK